MAGRLRGWFLNNSLCETRYKSCVLHKTMLQASFLYSLTEQIIQNFEIDLKMYISVNNVRLNMNGDQEK
jgi:hypothetical protein